ncbi:MAG TPA: hypothetical protein VI479_21940 [Blastocatellia bacterium]
MAIPIVEEPHINFKIDGIIALCVNEGRRRFDVGVVRTAKGHGDIPGHGFSMVINKRGDEEPLAQFNSKDIPKELSLKIIDQRPSVGIELYTPELFNRQNREMNNHFKWTLDIGNGELHSGPVRIHRRALRSVLRVTGVETAIFFTGTLSSDQLLVKINHDKREIGYVAGAIEALIPIPKKGAVFSPGRGREPIHLKYGKDVIYDIIYEQVCRSHSDCSQADAGRIFQDLFSVDKHGFLDLFSDDKHCEEIEIIGLPHTRARAQTESIDTESLQNPIIPKINIEIGCIGVNFSANNELPSP